MKQISAACLTILMLTVLVSCKKDNNSLHFEESANTSSQISYLEITELDLQTSNEREYEIIPEETAAEQEKKYGKTLIAYFSLVDIVPEDADAVTHATSSIGNTEYAAMEIQRQTGGDLFAIKTVRNYPVSHRECSEIAEEEMRSDARPELSSHLENMEEYDTVYIGYPIWWYIEPMAIRTFLDEYDFSGKTVIPFCTSLGAGIGESEENIAELANGAEVLEGITLYAGRQDVSEDIASWLEDIGMVE